VLLAHNNYTLQGCTEMFFHEVAPVLAASGHEVRFCRPPKTGSRHLMRICFQRRPITAMEASRREPPAMIYKTFARMIGTFRPDNVHALAIYVLLTPAILDEAREPGTVTTSNPAQRSQAINPLRPSGKRCRQTSCSPGAGRYRSAERGTH